MKRILLIYLTTILLAAGVFAIPAKPGIATRIQSDGSIVSFERFGDEFSHYTIADGIYTVVEDRDGDFCYATLRDNRLISSGVKVRPTNKLSNKERDIATQSVGLRPVGHNPLFNRQMNSSEVAIAQRIKEQAASHVEANERALEIADWGGSVLGERKLLVILVEYTDVRFSINKPVDKFLSLLNDEGYSTNGCNGSVKDYFEYASNGKFSPTFDVAGPFCLSNNREYYGGNDGNGNDRRPAYQAVEACDLAEQAGVDFSQYDNDGDGELDLMFIVYAGHNEAEGGPDASVWPHNWDIYPGKNILQSSYPTYDGKRLTTYSCTSELQGYTGTQMCNIGTFCHEFGHALGLPDWYDTEGGAGFGMSWASIMNSGSYLNNSRTPPTYNIIERWMLGWAFPTEISETGYYEIDHVSKDEGYIIWANDNKTECFLFESRTKGGNCLWDEYLNAGDSALKHQGGEGMLVYHLDWDSDVMVRWEQHTINCDPSHECASLFRSVPTAGESSSKGWFFPGSRNVKSLSFETIPKLQSWSNDKLPFYLDHITIAGSKMTFYAMVKELIVDVRQYDALIDWQAANTTSKEWVVKCTDKATNEVVYQKSTTSKYVDIYPLNTNSDYFVEISGDDSSEPPFEFEVTTQSNVLTPMSALNLSATHKASNFIRLGVKNLDCIVDDIKWYVNGEPTEDTYLKLAAGTYQICAAITDPEGNIQYLYRDITVQ